MTTLSPTVDAAFAARQVVAAMADAHLDRCDASKYSAEPCPEMRELMAWLQDAEELYACALDGIEFGSPAHARLRAYEDAEFERGFNDACEDRATCPVHHLLADLIGGR